MKFILFVEGRTESKNVPSFLKRWLDVKLKYPIGLKPVRFGGWSELVNDMPKKALMYLNGPDREDIVGVIGLLDLYGPTFYPQNTITANDRIDWARNELERRVGDKCFRMFFAVHEVEAWLLSQPEVFPPKMSQALSRESKHPENVDFDTPPSRRLEILYRRETGREYKKTTHGSQLFAKLDPEVAASKCPQLRCMLECMLEMAENAGKKAEQL